MELSRGRRAVEIRGNMALMALRDVFVVDAVRTPIGRFRGALSEVRPDDLGARVIAELVRRSGPIRPPSTTS